MSQRKRSRVEVIESADRSIALDPTDVQILDVLQADSGITNVELSRRIGMSPATTLERVKKLENKGIIRKYVALVDHSKLNLSTMAYVFVTLDTHAREPVERFREQVKALPEVLECYHMAGEIDYLLKVVGQSIQVLERFLLDHLAGIENVAKMRTSFVFSQIKHETKISLSRP